MPPRRVVCALCRTRLTAGAARHPRYPELRYCSPCERMTGLAVPGIERDPAKWGGHTPRGPK